MEPNEKVIQGGQPGGNVPGASNNNVADVEELKKLVEGLTQKVGELTAQNQSLQANQSRFFSPEFIQSLRGPSAPAQPEPTVDLNQLDNAGLTKHLIQNIGSLLDQKFGMVSKDINVLKAHQMIGEVRFKHGDFDDFLPKIREIWQENPGLSPEAAYKLAKYGSEDAIAEIERVREAKAQEAENASRQTGRPGEGSSFNLEAHKDLTPDQQIDEAAKAILTSTE